LANSPTIRKDFIDVIFGHTAKGQIIPNLLVNYIPGSLQQVPEEIDIFPGEKTPVSANTMFYFFYCLFHSLFTVYMVQPSSHFFLRYIRHFLKPPSPAHECVISFLITLSCDNLYGTPFG